MPLRKKKISELPLADSLKGLYTIGYKIIDGIKTSVRLAWKIFRPLIRMSSMQLKIRGSGQERK